MAKTSARKDETTQWPFIRWKEDRQRWLVDARTKDGGERRYFESKPEAEGFAQQQRVLRQNEGSTVFDDRELASYGWTVANAIDFALAHLRRENASCGLKEAIDSLLDFKRSRVEGDRLSDIQSRLGKFEKFMGPRKISLVNGDDINAFLETIPHPATRNDYRKEIVMLWGYAKAKPRQWVAEAIDKSEVPRAAEPEKGRVILTVEQARALMSASTDDDIRALNSMVLFGGLRREEVEKLDWSAVNFKTGYIEISTEVSKVNRERYAPITPNLRAWLEPIAKKSGKIITRNLMHPLRRTWKRAGLYPWPQDAHRHSFISYRRRIIGDAQTAIDAGTSETIIKRHYKRPTMMEDAVAYFEILPIAA